MRIVIIGSGFGGLNAAIKIRKKLKDSDHDVIVISEKEEFVFRPSLIWLPFHQHSMTQFTFPLPPTYEKIGVTFIEKCVLAIKPKQHEIICDDHDIIEYDYLIIASGASPDWASIKGLDGVSESVFDIPSGLETRKKLEHIKDSDPIVIGIAEGNPNPGIAYEFLFELYDYLNKQRLTCPITFFTYEKELYEGNGDKPSEKLDQLMKEKHVSCDRRVLIKKVKDEKVYLSNGKQLPFSFLLVLPPYKGKDYIFSSKDIEHENGILPVHDTLQSAQWDNIYVIGDANNVKGIKTGRAAELQGVLAADNIMKQMNQEPLKSFQPETLYLMELGKDGAMMIMNKATDHGTIKWTMSGMIPHMMKRAFEKYYLLKFG